MHRGVICEVLVSTSHQLARMSPMFLPFFLRDSAANFGTSWTAAAGSSLQSSVRCFAASAAAMDKIKVANPVVDLDGDEMTRCDVS
jgi:hypothetical protein